MLNNVALIFRKSGRQKAAEPYYLHALQIYEKQLGPDHADVASVLNNLAVFYTNERRYTEAEKNTSSRVGHSREAVLHPRIRISRNPNATLPWSIIRVATTRRRLSFIALRSRAGRRRAKNPPKITRLSPRITPIFCVLLARRVKRINWKSVRARDDRANLAERRSLALRSQDRTSLV